MAKTLWSFGHSECSRVKSSSVNKTKMHWYFIQVKCEELLQCSVKAPHNPLTKSQCFVIWDIVSFEQPGPGMFG